MTSKARKPAAKKVEIEADTLRRLQNTILLQNRVHFGRTTGKTIGQFGGNFIAGVLDPLEGLSQLFGFVEGLGGGLRDGVQTSRVIFIEAKTRSKGKTVEALTQRLKKAKDKEKETKDAFLSDEEIAQLAPAVASI